LDEKGWLEAVASIDAKQVKREVGLGCRTVGDFRKRINVLLVRNGVVECKRGGPRAAEMPPLEVVVATFFRWESAEAAPMAEEVVPEEVVEIVDALRHVSGEKEVEEEDLSESLEEEENESDSE
jgi:hypothetical protein